MHQSISDAHISEIQGIVDNVQVQLDTSYSTEQALKTGLNDRDEELKQLAQSKESIATGVQVMRHERDTAIQAHHDAMGILDTVSSHLELAQGEATGLRRTKEMISSGLSQMRHERDEAMQGIGTLERRIVGLVEENARELESVQARMSDELLTQTERWQHQHTMEIQTQRQHASEQLQTQRVEFEAVQHQLLKELNEVRAELKSTCSERDNAVNRVVDMRKRLETARVHWASGPILNFGLYRDWMMREQNVDVEGLISRDDGDSSSSSPPFGISTSPGMRSVSPGGRTLGRNRSPQRSPMSPDELHQSVMHPRRPTDEIARSALNLASKIAAHEEPFLVTEESVSRVEEALLGSNRTLSEAGQQRASKLHERIVAFSSVTGDSEERCSVCGNVFKMDSTFCRKCGTARKSQEESAKVTTTV